MAEIIELVPTKREKKIRAIEFMQDLIKQLEKDRIDPEKIIVFLKWVTHRDEKGFPTNEAYEVHDNIKITENLLGCIKIMEDKIIKDCLE